MKIKVLCENTVCRDELGCEHGLSLYIEAGGKKILFDMGQSELFSQNAAVMGVDLQAVDLAVLSHGHYDHGGGLAKFLSLNQKAPVYISEKAFGMHYSGNERYIGLDTALKDHPRIIYASGETPLFEGARLISADSIIRKYPPTDAMMNISVNGKMQSDNFHHEQYLIIEEAGKKVVISGCSHRGAMNIIESLRPDVLIGGLHFMRLSPDDEKDRAVLENYASLIRNSGVKCYTCHCTGEEQYRTISPIIKDNLSYISAGSEFTV